MGELVEFLLRIYIYTHTHAHIHTYTCYLRSLLNAIENYENYYSNILYLLSFSISFGRQLFSAMSFMQSILISIYSMQKTLSSSDCYMLELCSPTHVTLTHLETNYTCLVIWERSHPHREFPGTQRTPQVIGSSGLYKKKKPYSMINYPFNGGKML